MIEIERKQILQIQKWLRPVVKRAFMEPPTMDLKNLWSQFLDSAAQIPVLLLVRSALSARRTACAIYRPLTLMITRVEVLLVQLAAVSQLRLTAAVGPLLHTLPILRLTLTIV